MTATSATLSKPKNFRTNPKSEALKQRTLELFRALSTASPPQAQRIKGELVQLNQGLVDRYANMWFRLSGHPFEDLQQVGTLGLIRTIDTFDYRLGKAFSSFAAPKIRGEIQHYLRDKGVMIRVPRRWLDAKPKIQKYREQGLSNAEIEAALRWYPGELQQALEALSTSNHCASMEAFELDCFERSYRTLDLRSPDTIVQLSDDGFFNATEICKKEGKIFKRFWRNQFVKKRVQELKKVRETDLFVIQRGRRGGAFLHRSLAPEFLIWVNERKYKPLLQEMLIHNLDQVYGDGNGNN